MQYMNVQMSPYFSLAQLVFYFEQCLPQNTAAANYRSVLYRVH